MPCTCLSVCVDVTAKFGLQCQDLNISLTAIGLLVRNCVTVSAFYMDVLVYFALLISPKVRDLGYK